MSKKDKNSFIASDKVVRFKLGPQAADVLAVLIYKYGYWMSTERMVIRNGKKYFFISLNDLIAESSYSKSVIAKNIKLLKKEGLVLTIQQGLNKPNLYSLDMGVVESYINKYKVKLKEWQVSIRENSLTSINRRKCNNDTSGILKIEDQESKKTTATKNKNTKNKNTENKITNQASLVEENDLEKMINSLRSCTDDLVKESITNEVYHHLINIVPQLKGFAMSNQDKALILQVCDSEIDAWKIVDKILHNAEYIKVGKKESRFGNLFVGVREIITNYEKCLTNV